MEKKRLRERLPLGEKVFYNRNLKYGYIASNFKLFELTPQEGVIRQVLDFECNITKDVILSSYTILGSGHIFADENIHTAFRTKEEYYEYLAGQIVYGGNKSYIELISNAIKNFFISKK